jgi:hypothetical protein
MAARSTKRRQQSFRCAPSTLSDDASVHPPPDNDSPSWHDNNGRADDGASNDHGTACGDAARPIDAARADDGVCVRHAHRDEASCQQYRGY